MAIDISKLGHVAADVLEMEPDCEELSRYSVEEVFDKYLVYNGIIGYTKKLMNALKIIQEAEIK
jgi:hypothetical protein